MFEDIKIFLAYKTEKWLSVVYSIKADEPSIKTGKGLAEIPLPKIYEYLKVDPWYD
ncbi:MAG: hypothetical protein K2K21_00730 [Lachnospiraceae bacterium]|nr:hypothetical protein [Lachnospiraceae bacterium]